MPQLSINFDVVPDFILPIKPGIYDMMVSKTSIEQVTGEGKTGMKLVVDLEVFTEGDQKGRKTSDHISTKMETKLKRLAMSAGVPVTAAGFNTDDLVGKIVKIRIFTETYKDPKRNMEMREVSRVDDYLIPGDAGFPKA